MSLNVDFQVERKKVNWNGQEVAEVRGLTPNDIVRVIAENPEQADTVLSAIERGGFKPSADDSADDIAASLQKGAAESFGMIVSKCPDIVAKVIAVACDAPDQWEIVRDRHVVPLQFELAQEIARLTFVDPPAFRRFVGNVMALIGVFQTTGQRRPLIDSDG